MGFAQSAADVELCVVCVKPVDRVRRGPIDGDVGEDESGFAKRDSASTNSKRVSNKVTRAASCSTVAFNVHNSESVLLGSGGFEKPTFGKTPLKLFEMC